MRISVAMMGCARERVLVLVPSVLALTRLQPFQQMKGLVGRFLNWMR